MEFPADLVTFQGLGLAALGVFGLVFAILAFRNRIVWGSARRMGIPAIVFTWMGLIYWLVLFDGAYGFVGILLGLPIWIDVVLFLIILILSMTIYFKLLHRETFKRNIFLTMFLIPLSIPGIHTAAQFTPKVAHNLSPGHFQTAIQSTKQWLGKVKIGSLAPARPLRRMHMEDLYEKQKGMDALCRVPLPPLYVGPIWNRKLNLDIEIDHKIPKAKGGSDQVSNLQLTHRQFNRARGALTGDDLRRAKLRFCP